MLPSDKAKNRYKIIIEYLGTGLCGWQRQDHALSVQQIIEEAIFSFTGEKVEVTAAGRTDAGVHALAQAAHFNIVAYKKPETIPVSINHFTRPHKVVITHCEQVANDFHARFSASARHYLYRIINRKAKTVMEEERAWWIRKELDIKAMREGASYLVGHHDFSSFRASYCQAKSPVKTLSLVEIKQEGEIINFYLSAPSFLHHMVRNIVGSLAQVGIGKWQPKDIKIALEAKKRHAGGVTAPAHGLYFLKVDY